MSLLAPAPLTKAGFAPFGEVIETDGARHWPINDGYAERFHDLAALDPGEGGRIGLSLFRARPRTLPLPIRVMERHPLASQAFLPLGPTPFLIVVAPPGPFRAEALAAFVTAPGQGCNYARGVWHHPLIALAAMDFAVLDRIGEGDNLDEVTLDGSLVLAADLSKGESNEGRAAWT